VYLPQTPEAFTYDSDGNLTQEGRWDYTWDGENRLIAMQTRSAVLASGVPEQRLEFAYDPQSRRISKTVSNKVSGAWSRIVAQRFLYDGWNLLAILNPQSSIVQSFAWGLDLSGSLQGAGGVGGLLWVSDATTINGQPSAHGACYDGNGNVAALVNFADGSLSARYEYGPFGEAVRQTGAMAEANPFCFSTKFTDNESGHLYYGYRYYLPSLGRWASRDPLGERGGVNVYSFLSANPIARIDRLGLDFWNGGEISGEYDEVISRGSQQLGTRVTRTWSRALTRIYAHVDTGCPCTRSYYVADYAQYLDYVDTDYYTWEIHKNVDLAESEMWGTIAELCGEMYEAGDWPCAAVAVLCAAMSGATRDLPANTSYYRVDTVLTSRSWRRGNEWVAISPGRLSSKEVISSRRCETTTTYHPFTGLEMPYFETVAAEGVYVHSRTVTPLVNMNGDTVWSICRGFSVN
jgi:RHS repeat-associated protein